MQVEIGYAIIAGIASGALTATGFVFLLGRRYQAIEEHLKALFEKNREQDAKIEKLETDQTTMTKENNESWQDLNRTLGQIEGSIGMLPPPPPPRKTRP